MMIAPHETQPLLVGEGVTEVVSEVSKPETPPVMKFPTSHDGLSHVPYTPGNGGELAPKMEVYNGGSRLLLAPKYKFSPLFGLPFATMWVILAVGLRLGW